MSKQRRHNGTRKGRGRKFDDEHDGGRSGARHQDLGKGKVPKRIKNEKVLLDILAENPEAQEELTTD